MPSYNKCTKGTSNSGLRMQSKALKLVIASSCGLLLGGLGINQKKQELFLSSKFQTNGILSQASWSRVPATTGYNYNEWTANAMVGGPTGKAIAKGHEENNGLISIIHEKNLKKAGKYTGLIERTVPMKNIREKYMPMGGPKISLVKEMLIGVKAVGFFNYWNSNVGKMRNVHLSNFSCHHKSWCLATLSGGLNTFFSRDLFGGHGIFSTNLRETEKIIQLMCLGLFL